MLKKLKKFTRNMIAGANVATIVLMLLIGYSDRLDPMEFPRLTNIGLAFPLFLLINVGFLVFWLLFKKRFALIPIAGFLIGYNPIRTYCPLNLPKTASDSTLKVLSYNVYFAHERVKDGTKERVLDFLRQENADIVCLQEIYFKKDDYPTLHAMYPYVSSEYGSGGTDYITTLSRYPIIKREDVPLEKKKGRHSTAVFLDIEGDTVIIVNNHLASTMLTFDDRENFNKIVKGDYSGDFATKNSKRIAEKLADGTIRRVPQVNALVDFLHENKGKSIILCGDFNDGPISHSRYSIAQHLTDCYREAGNGPGISYNDHHFYVHIDHIFCSNDWEPQSCKVMSKIKHSDHYPIVSRLKKRPKH